MIRRPPRSTPFPTRRSSDLVPDVDVGRGRVETELDAERRAGRLGARELREPGRFGQQFLAARLRDRKSTRLNSSHANISYAAFCLKKKTNPPCPSDPHDKSL